MKRLRELFLGAWRALRSDSLAQPHAFVCACVWPGGCARLGLGRELLGAHRPLGWGSITRRDPQPLQPLCAAVGLGAGLPGFPMCHCPLAESLPSLPSLLEHRGAVPRQAGGEPEQPWQLPAAEPG